MRTRIAMIAGAATLALVATLGSPGPAGAGPDSPTPPTPAARKASTTLLKLSTPRRVTGYGDGKDAYVNLNVRLTAPAGAVELWSRRTAWNQPITSELRHGGTAVPLPAGTMRTFAGLPRFLTVTVRNKKGKVVHRKTRNTCLNGASERAVPSAPATSPYPLYCPPSTGFIKGSVQGIQDGWGTNISGDYQHLRVKPGSYTVTARITPRYRRLFGIPKASARSTFKLRIRKIDESEWYRTQLARAATSHQGKQSQPSEHRPAGSGATPVSGPVPDLRSLPATGMRISPGGNHLEFSATVWNAGGSPLVIDGFRKSRQLMDTYQYFFDSDGNQTGYRKVGLMHWHDAPSHMHWHLMDFARYSLLSKNKVERVRSRKQSFCLANTDATDYTVPGADWQPDQTDLESSCGEEEAQSIRQTLASGSGDTYDQSRAGQSFSLKGLKNGVYYIQVLANPRGNLTESSTTNNVSLRRIRIGGKPGARTVTFSRIGKVKEGSYDY